MIPEIPVAVAAAAATLVENAVALLSVTLALVALDAGMEIVASTLTLALVKVSVVAYRRLRRL